MKNILFFIFISALFFGCPQILSAQKYRTTKSSYSHKKTTIKQSTPKRNKTYSSSQTSRAQDETRIRSIKSWIVGYKWYGEINFYGRQCFFAVGFCGDLIEVFVDEFQHYVSNYSIDLRSHRIYYKDPSGNRKFLIIDEDNHRLKTSSSSYLTRR